VTLILYYFERKNPRKISDTKEFIRILRDEFGLNYFAIFLTFFFFILSTSKISLKPKKIFGNLVNEYTTAVIKKNDPRNKKHTQNNLTNVRRQILFLHHI
jgi:hypothetical protein